MRTHVSCHVIDSDHLQCNSDSPAGCQRCRILPPLVCCELCNPHLFEDFAKSDPGERPHRARNRTTVKDYEAEHWHMELRNALDNFREMQTIKQFGIARLKNSGSSVIMSDTVLKRIVDCAHAGKIKSKDDLQHETRWSRASTLADDVLSLIAAHQVVPLTNVSVTRIHTCGACSEKGHNSMSIATMFSSILTRHTEANRKCIKHLPRSHHSNKENTPLPSAPTTITLPIDPCSFYSS